MSISSVNVGDFRYNSKSGLLKRTIISTIPEGSTDVDVVINSFRIDFEAPTLVDEVNIRVLLEVETVTNNLPSFFDITDKAVVSLFRLPGDTVNNDPASNLFRLVDTSGGTPGVQVLASSLPFKGYSIVPMSAMNVNWSVDKSVVAALPGIKIQYKLELEIVYKQTFS